MIRIIKLKHLKLIQLLHSKSKLNFVLKLNQNTELDEYSYSSIKINFFQKTYRIAVHSILVEKIIK